MAGDEIAWWENIDGVGTLWEKHSLDQALDAATELFAADVDGDGDLDVLEAAQLEDEINWWENPAGDGDLDVVAGLYNQDGTGAVVWWAARVCPADCAPEEPDGMVGILDFLALLAAWGAASVCDLDGDGVVGILDLLDLLASWGPYHGNGTSQSLR